MASAVRQTLNFRYQQVQLRASRASNRKAPGFEVQFLLPGTVDEPNKVQYDGRYTATIRVHSLACSHNNCKQPAELNKLEPVTISRTGSIPSGAHWSFLGVPFPPRFRHFRLGCVCVITMSDATPPSQKPLDPSSIYRFANQIAQFTFAAQILAATATALKCTMHDFPDFELQLPTPLPLPRGDIPMFCVWHC
jgi:hypothetical protein